MIVKILGISGFLYIASLINVPEWVINTSGVESAIYGFVWKGKKDRIKRTVLINDFRNGGLNMVDIRSKNASLKANVVKKENRRKLEHLTTVNIVFGSSIVELPIEKNRCLLYAKYCIYRCKYSKEKTNFF